MRAEKQFLSPKEFSVTTSLSAPTIARRLRDGTIPHVKLGRRVLIPAAYLQTLAAQAEYKPLDRVEL